MRVHAIIPLVLLVSQPAAVLAADTGKYHVTAEEKAACTSDAIRLCMQTYPNEDLLLACMKQNHDALSGSCRVAFDAGIKRRRL